MYFLVKSRKISQNLSSAIMMIDALNSSCWWQLLLSVDNLCKQFGPKSGQKNVKSDLVPYCLTLMVFTKIFEKLVESKKAFKILHPACRVEP